MTQYFPQMLDCCCAGQLGEMLQIKSSCASELRGCEMGKWMPLSSRILWIHKKSPTLILLPLARGWYLSTLEIGPSLRSVPLFLAKYANFQKLTSTLDYIVESQYPGIQVGRENAKGSWLLVPIHSLANRLDCVGQCSWAATLRCSILWLL